MASRDVTERVQAVDDHLAGEGGPVVGVALAVTDERRFQLHTGVVHRSATTPASILHLAFHHKLRNDKLPDQNTHYIWIPLDLDADRASAFAGYCRRIFRRSPLIPYGILYEGGEYAQDGTIRFAGREIGLTCATFVLAVFGGAGIKLLDHAGWPSRPSDQSWHLQIVNLLNGRATAQHVQAVRSELGCARFRPAEVAAAAGLRRPANFIHAERAGRDLSLGFVLAAVLSTILEGIFE